MSLKLFRQILNVRTACAAAALGLGLATAAQAQPYYSSNYSDDTATVGGITVTPERRLGVTASGAPIVMARASRVVDFDDLDLNTGAGVHELYRRVSLAAADACDQLDHDYTMGRYPLDDGNNVDCQARAIHRAMRDAPIGDNSGY